MKMCLGRQQQQQQMRLVLTWSLSASWRRTARVAVASAVGGQWEAGHRGQLVQRWQGVLQAVWGAMGGLAIPCPIVAVGGAYSVLYTHHLRAAR